MTSVFRDTARFDRVTTLAVFEVYYPVGNGNMKVPIIVILTTVIVVIAVFRYQRLKARKAAHQAKSVETCLALREQILTLDPHAAGIHKFIGTNQVWGVVMEMGFPETTVTLVALADGNASLYFSGRGGVIGGVGHESVRQAASRMSEVADTFVSSCSSTTDFPFPAQGEIVFYILMKQGKVTAKAPENDLGEQKHVMSPLFYAGQNVITELRLVTEDFK